MLLLFHFHKLPPTFFLVCYTAGIGIRLTLEQDVGREGDSYPAKEKS